MKSLGIIILIYIFSSTDGNSETSLLQCFINTSLSDTIPQSENEYKLQEYKRILEERLRSEHVKHLRKMEDEKKRNKDEIEFLEKRLRLEHEHHLRRLMEEVEEEERRLIEEERRRCQMKLLKVKEEERRRYEEDMKRYELEYRIKMKEQGGINIKEQKRRTKTMLLADPQNHDLVKDYIGDCDSPFFSEMKARKRLDVEREKLEMERLRLEMERRKLKLEKDKDSERSRIEELARKEAETASRESYNVSGYKSAAAESAKVQAAILIYQIEYANSQIGKRPDHRAGARTCNCIMHHGRASHFNSGRSQSSCEILSELLLDQNNLLKASDTDYFSLGRNSLLLEAQLLRMEGKELSEKYTSGCVISRGPDFEYLLEESVKGFELSRFR